MHRAHAQRLGRDLLEIALSGEKHRHRVVLDGGLLDIFLHLVGEDDAGFTGLGIFLRHLLELGDDDVFDAPAAAQDILEIRDLLLQRVGLLQTLEDILAVDVAQADFRHVLGLHLVDAEADHQVGDHVGLFFRLADDLDGLVDVQKDFAEAPQQVQLLLLLADIEEDAPLDALGAPCGPLLQNLSHAHNAGRAADQDVEVAGEGIRQRRQLIQLLHQLLRVRAALEVDGELQAAQIRLVAHIADLPDLAGLHQLRDLIKDLLRRGGIGDLINFDHILLRQVPPAASDLEAAPSGAVDLPHLGGVVENLAARGEIRGGKRGQQVVL